MFDHYSEDALSRRIARLVARAEEGGYDDDPDFVEMIEWLYQKRAEMYEGTVRTGSPLPRLPSMS